MEFKRSLSLGIIRKGESSLSIDLTNEMDSIPLSYEGVTEDDYELSTSVKMYYGTTEVDIANITVSGCISGVTVTPVKDDNNKFTGELKINVSNNTDFGESEKNVIRILASSDYGDLSTSFLLQGIKAGEAGLVPNIYRLIPSSNSITFNSDYEYSEDTLTCSYEKITGNSPEESNVSIKMFIDNDTEVDYADITLSTRKPESFIKYRLYVGTKLVDTETVSIVYDGADGNFIWTTETEPTGSYIFNKSDLLGSSTRTPKVNDIIVSSYYRYTIIEVDEETVTAGYRTNIRGADGYSAFYIDLDNDMETIPLSSEGKTTDSYTVTTGVHLYYGTEKVSISEDPVITNLPDNVTYSLARLEDPEDHIVSYDINFFIESDKSFNKGIITITAKNDVYGELPVDFIVQGVKSGSDGESPVMYTLVPSISVIKVDKEGEYTPSTVECSQYSVVGTEYTPSSKILKYQIDNGTQKTYTSGIDTSSINLQIKFFLYDTDNTLLDMESIPVVIDGTDGVDGADGVTQNNQLLRATNTNNTDCYRITGNNGFSDKYWNKSTETKSTVEVLTDRTDVPDTNIKTVFEITTQVTGHTDIRQSGISFTIGQKYTVSCWAKTDNTACMFFQFGPNESGNYPNNDYRKCEVSSEWKKFSWTFTPDKSTANIYFGVVAPTIGTKFDIAGMKMELGETASDWCEYELDKAKNAITMTSLVSPKGEYIDQIGTYAGLLYKWNGTEWELFTNTLPTDAVVHYSFNDIPDLPDGIYYIRAESGDTYDNHGYITKYSSYTTLSNNNGNLRFTCTANASTGAGLILTYANINNHYLGQAYRMGIRLISGSCYLDNNNKFSGKQFISVPGDYEMSGFFDAVNGYDGNFVIYNGNVDCVFELTYLYIGDGDYFTPVIDNSKHGNHGTINKVFSEYGICGKAALFTGKGYIETLLPFFPEEQKVFTISAWVKDWDKSTIAVLASNWTSYNIHTIHLRLSSSTNNILMDVVRNNNETQNLFRFIFPYNFSSDNLSEYHVCAVFNGSNSFIILNGKRLTSNNSVDTFYSGALRRGYAFIGKFYGQSGWSYTKAIIDDYLIFDRALSESEALALYVNRANSPRFYTIQDYNTEIICDDNIIDFTVEKPRLLSRWKEIYNCDVKDTLSSTLPTSSISYTGEYKSVLDRVNELEIPLTQDGVRAYIEASNSIRTMLWDNPGYLVDLKCNSEATIDVDDKFSIYRAALQNVEGVIANQMASKATAISIVQGNQYQMLPVNSSGSVTSYEGTTNTIQVIEGANIMTPIASSGTLVAGSFKLTATGTYITAGNVTVDSTNSKMNVSACSGLTSGHSSATVNYTINYMSKNGTEGVLYCEQKITRSAQGADAVSYELTATPDYITKTQSGTSSASSITFNAVKISGSSRVTNVTMYLMEENGTAWKKTGNFSNGVYTLSTVPTVTKKYALSLTDATNGSGIVDYLTIAVITDGKDGNTPDVYTCECSMASVGSAVTVNVYTNGVKKTGTLYYSDFYGTGTNAATTTGKTGTVTNGAVTVAAVSNATKHLVKIFSDAERTDLLCSGFVSYGTTGSASYSYWLVSDVSSIRKNKSGSLVNTTINLTGRYKAGSGTPANYSGRFEVEWSANGTSWTTIYSSSANEATTAVDISECTSAIVFRVTLYYAGGLTTMLDQDTINVIQDGADGGRYYNLYRVDDFGKTKAELMAAGDWQESLPEIPDGKCLYFATKFIS